MGRDEMRASNPPESHMIRGGSTPALPRASWLGWLSSARSEIDESSLTAPPGVPSMEMREVIRPTSSLAMTSRFSACLQERAERAPVQERAERAPVK